MTLEMEEYDFIRPCYATPIHITPGVLSTGGRPKADRLYPRTVNAVMTEEMLKDVETRCREMMADQAFVTLKRVSKSLVVINLYNLP